MIRSSLHRRINDTVAPLLIRANQNGDFKDKDLKIWVLTVRNVYSINCSSEEILFDAIFDDAKME